MHLSEYKAPNKSSQQVRDEKDLLPAADKENAGIIFKEMLSLNKGSLETLSKKVHWGGTHSKAQSIKEYLTEHAQFKVSVTDSGPI